MHYEDVTNPDGSVIFHVHVQGGPFYWRPDLWGFVFNRFGYRLECYAGMRPTATWSLGFGNEGIFPAFKKMMRGMGYGNLGFALRFKKQRG